MEVLESQILFAIMFGIFVFTLSLIYKVMILGKVESENKANSTKLEGKKKKYIMITNDDATKYQVVESINETRVLYENEAEYEAKKVCEQMNIAHQEGKKEQHI